MYLASESSFYRILRAHNQLNHRGQSLAPQRSREATTHHAAGPCVLWSWDITYLASTVRGQFYYLYMFEDVYSRKIVGYEVYEVESGDYAAGLLQRCLLREQCLHQPLVLHSDNGAPMKAQTMKAKMEELGVIPSYSRPRVSNDNAFSESLFKTLKYRPEWPSSGLKASVMHGALGRSLRDLVQHRAQAQQTALRHTARAAYWRGCCHSGSASACAGASQTADTELLGKSPGQKLRAR